MSAEFIRDICLSFPGVKEDIKWQHELCFLTSDKIFCMTHLEDDFGVSFKVKDEQFDELAGRDGIIPAPYLARYKWIYVNDINCFNKKEWEKLLKQSYTIIKDKKNKKQRKN